MLLKPCVYCFKLTKRRDSNNDYYCDEHMHCSLKNEKRTKRIYIDEDLYYCAVAKAAQNKLDFRVYLANLINSNDSQRQR